MTTREKITAVERRIGEVKSNIARLEIEEPEYDTIDLQIELYELESDLRFLWADDEEETLYEQRLRDEAAGGF